MKKVILLFTLAATLTSAIQAQCPAQIQDQQGDGSVYFLTIASIAQCAAVPHGTPVTINSGNYLVSNCGDLTGDGTPILIQLTLNTGTPVVLATAAPVSFTFGMTTCTYNASGFPPSLPIQLIDFKGIPSVSGNVLTWTTANELNNKHFNIERSTDGKTFHGIGQVKGNNKPSTYQFVDESPLWRLGSYYYRLRQIDFDGTETLSKIVSIELKSKGLTIYPTLVSDGILTVDTEGGQFQIFNLLGQQVLNHATSARFETAPTLINVAALPQGTYILKVGTEQAKFVKQ
jgi:hypothetical protein